jgi:hypothetical protein
LNTLHLSHAAVKRARQNIHKPQRIFIAGATCAAFKSRVCVYVFLKSDIDLEIKCTSENMLVIFHLLSITLGAELERAEQRDRVTKAFLLKDFSLCVLLCVCVRARERVSLLAAHAVLFTRILRVTSSFVLIEGSSGP